MYVNRFYSSREMVKEFVDKIICRRLRYMGVILSIIIMFIAALGGTSTIGVGVFYLIFVIALEVITPKIELKYRMNYANKIHNGTHPECIVIFDSNIKIKEGTFELQIEYEQITALYKLKSCNVLMFTRQNGISYLSGAFVGDASGFDEFIMSRCKNIKKVKSYI